ncbi:phosphoesterase [Polychytrium aggregatum]|uniref:phosphoesterase n=1 Tax=Polychytrium aggregatum TaxID=110093 RepID=UPI0022FE5670|nr:phosphoesterase [Polychytrium aggregatum]KAI9204420.1 phosphoesterase [Polychytrium aggregatum]
MIILLENQDYSAAVAASYMSSLLQSGTLLSNYLAITHPSQPNYIALVSGSTNGVTSDSSVNLNVKNIADLLEAKGLTWKNYAEVGGCFTGSTSGKYARKHVPFLSFTDISTSSRCDNIVTSDQLAADEASGNLPNLMFYTPDLNNDGHDTGVTYADNWLQSFLPSRLSNPVHANTLFFVTFDESENYNNNNQVYSILLGKGARPGVDDSTSYNHYSFLATVEDNFGLGNLGQNDASAAAFTLV